MSVDGSPEKLRACLMSVSSWASETIIIVSEGDEVSIKISEEFGAKVHFCNNHNVRIRWEAGLSILDTSWGLLIRSTEIVTGKLRNSITDILKKTVEKSCKIQLPRKVIFLGKRLKYPLNHCDLAHSFLLHTFPKNSQYPSNFNLQKKGALKGALLCYEEETLLDCINSVIKRAHEISNKLSLNTHLKISFVYLFLCGFKAAIENLFRVYLKQKGFKEGFEGIIFALYDASVEFFGHLLFYEKYIRGGKIVWKDLPFVKNILVIKLRDIGDNILCTPLIKNLHKKFPDTSISVLTYSYSKPVFEENPYIKRIFGLSKEPSSYEINKLVAELNVINFDFVINTHGGKLSSKLLSKIESKFCINNHYQGRNKFYDIITKESDYYRSSIERDLDCMRSLGLEVVDTKTDIFLTSDEIDWARNKMKTCGLEPEKKTLLFHPSAAVPIREWPLERFGELIKKFTQKKNIQTIAMCTEVEFPRIKPLLNYNPNLKIFHQMTLRQMMAVIHQCDLVVDNDSSPSHVATALGIPTIVLFSQAIREVFRPYHPDKDQHFVFHNNVHCRECELTSCDDRICLDFSPDEVYAKILETIDVPPKK